MQYAFDEFRHLVRKLGTSIDDRNPIVHYLCALVSELAYYHVPEFEFDDKKRSQIIPCEAYQNIIKSGYATNITSYLQTQLEEGTTFVVIDRGVVIVGIKIDKLLFIGFRGTSFLFDWRINLRAGLVEIPQLFFQNRYTGRFEQGGRVHRGFAEESLRISSKILDVLRDKKIEDIDHIFLTGHSLGGAVAALSENFLHIAPTSVCVFGTPRYSNIAAYYSLPYGPPTHIKRRGDIVPYVPPRKLGYIDHPYEFDTQGKPILVFNRNNSFLYFLWILTLFFYRRLEPHSMEKYRNELGDSAMVLGGHLPIAPVDKLKSNQVS